MLILAQIPGTEEALKAASAHSYEAVVMVLVVASAFLLIGWMVKIQTSRHNAIEERILTEAKVREERLADRVTKLEDLVRNELFAVIKNNSEMMGKMISASEAIIRTSENTAATLNRFLAVVDLRPCLLTVEKQEILHKVLNDVIAKVNIETGEA